MRKQNDIEKKFSLKEEDKMCSMFCNDSPADIELNVVVRDRIHINLSNDEIVDMNILPLDIYTKLINMSCPVSVHSHMSLFNQEANKYYLKYDKRYSWRWAIRKIVDIDSLDMDDYTINIWFNKETNDKLNLALKEKEKVIDDYVESLIRGIKDELSIIEVCDNTHNTNEIISNKLDESYKNELINEMLDFYYGNSEETGYMMLKNDSIFLSSEKRTIFVRYILK